MAGSGEQSILVTLDDGRRQEFASGITLLGVLEVIDPAAKKETIGATVNGHPVDLRSRLDQDAHVGFISASSPEGLSMLRHSAAHLMAAAVDALFPGSRFAIGPAIADGFYYDIEPPRALTPEDLQARTVPLFKKLLAGYAAFKMSDLSAEKRYPLEKIIKQLENSNLWN